MKRILTGAGVIAGTYLFLIMPSLRRHRYTEKMKQYRYAHRGLYDNQNGIPENSLKAFERAVNKGYGIELDVQLSKDGIPFIMHDFTLNRTARDSEGNAVSGKGYEYTFAELRAFHLFDTEEKIPSFQEVLDLVKGRVPLIMELKIENADLKMPVCAEAVKLLDAYDGLYCVESFNPLGVLWFRTHRPDVMRGQLSDCYARTIKKEEQFPLIHRPAEYLAGNFLTKPDFVAYNVKYERNLSRRLCRSLFKNTAVCWTVQTPEEMKEAQKHFDIVIFEGFEPGN